MCANSARVCTWYSSSQIYNAVRFFMVPSMLNNFPERFLMRQNLIKNLIKIVLLHATETNKGRSSTAILTIPLSLWCPVKRVCPVKSEEPFFFLGASCNGDWELRYCSSFWLLLLDHRHVCSIMVQSARYCWPWNQLLFHSPSLTHMYHAIAAS